MFATIPQTYSIKASNNDARSSSFDGFGLVNMANQQSLTIASNCGNCRRFLCATNYDDVDVQTSPEYA